MSFAFYFAKPGAWLEERDAAEATCRAWNNGAANTVHER